MRAFLGLEVWRGVVGNVFLFKMSFGWNFMMNHVEVMPWSSYSWLFQLSKYGNFCILRLFEPRFENHDQALIKWCLWLQNEMLTKNLDFWLSNDHFAPTVDCSAIRVLLKKSTEIDQGITFTWIIRKIPSKAHFEEEDISYNSSSYFKSKKCSHKKLSISTLQVIFKSQQKGTLSQRP